MDVHEWEELRRRRLSKNEQAFRDHNNRRVEFERQSVGVKDTVPFVCECGDPDCVEGIELTVTEYMGSHCAPNRFVVKPGHIFPDAERIAEQGDRYWCVDKFTLRTGVS